MIQRNFRHLGWSVVALALTLAACAQQERTAAPSVETKTFALTPATASVKVSFLTGELKDLRVVEGVEQGTGTVVEPPKLRATLKLKNSAPDQTVRLLSARIEYGDMEGQPIPLAEGRRDTGFKFYGYQDRLDPGMETSQDIDVPFPAAALKDKTLRDIRLEVSYIPTPYREDTATVRVSLAE